MNFVSSVLSQVLETSIATVVTEASSAINKLLFRELKEFVGLDEVLRLKSSSS